MSVSRTQGLRSSGAAGPHDSRPHRQRTRRDEREASVSEGLDEIQSLAAWRDEDVPFLSFEFSEDAHTFSTTNKESK